MKVLLSLLFAIGTVSQAQAVNLDRFQGVNFQATGDYCGLHIEVSGRRLIATNIIPPHSGGAYADCNKYSACTGSSWMVECNDRGDCYNSESQLVLVLLEDGNIFNNLLGVKNIRSYESQYWWCNK